MWDVKKQALKVFKEENKMFYLNYVGCKGGEDDCRAYESRKLRFTLTMWDVKFAMFAVFVMI